MVRGYQGEELGWCYHTLSLLEGARNEIEHARLLAALDKGSGTWLQALPILSVGLRMDDTTLRNIVGLHLGTTICAPHICQCCGVEVSAQGTHGLSCKARAGWHFCHAAINNIILRTMSVADIPAQLELSRRSDTGWYVSGAKEVGQTSSVGCNMPRPP